MADVRTYLVTNPSALFEAGRRIKFTSAAPAGSITRIKIDGRAVSVLLDDYRVGGHYFAAELQNRYL